MIWKNLKEKLEKGIKGILLIVIESKGSSPGRAGFKMVVFEDGSLQGSVGGGVMEYRLVELARKQLIDEGAVLLKRQVHGETSGDDASGMICSGSQVVAFIPVGSDDLSLIREIVNHRKGVITAGPEGLRHDPNRELPERIKSQIKADDDWIFEEEIGSLDELFIFGGGHVGLALSKLFHELDFRITVFDNRNKDLSTIRQNEFADEIKIIDYGKAEDFVPEGENSYVVIMTAGHEHDGLILEQLIEKDLRYLGMMGSPKKVKAIYNVLKKTGIPDTVFERVDAPIGIQINSQTPMEIAVSIAAKVIRERNS